MRASVSNEELSRLTTKYDVANIPGYLSYPTVARWSDTISDEEVLTAFRREVDTSTSGAYLYFHYPYCETLCYYCACYMQVTSEPESRYDAYLASLEKELALKVGDGPIRAGQMHWGGGTPTYMSAKQIERAFKQIDRRVKWLPDATLSIEAYPDARTLSDEKLDVLADLGFNEISFGIESLDPKVLEAINRKHDIEAIRHWVDKARARNFGVHVDLVYGLPYQTVENFQQTIELLLTIQPDRLATFSFMYTPFTIKHQRAIPRAAVPSSEERYRLYEVMQDRLADIGYSTVGVDHWVKGDKDPLAVAAKQGQVVYHFQGYEPADRETFLGFGSSAISFAQGRYFQNLRSIEEYTEALDAGKLPIIRGNAAHLTADDRIRHRVVMQHIMADLMVDKARIEAEFGIKFDEYFKTALDTLRDMERDKLVSGVDGPRIAIEPMGRAFIRNIAFAFDAHAGPAGAPVLRVVP